MWWPQAQLKRISMAVRDNPEINSFIASQTALGRVGLPDDIGGAIASLLSAENRWINGQRIEVSGGMFLELKLTSFEGKC